MGMFDKIKDSANQAITNAKDATLKLKGDVAADVRDDETSEVTATEIPPLYAVTSHISGKNAQVRLWPDRIEWERARGVSAGKVALATMTAGASMLATGIKGGKDGFDMVLLEHVTNVSNRKDGMLYHLVEVQTSSGAAVNTTAFRVSRDEAAEFRQAIITAMQAQKASSHPTVNVNVAQVAQSTAVSQSTPDFAGQLRQLAELRDAGILSELEFETKKTELLARM
ncbi:SHOCT domain-containing protein [Lysinibacter cavernae]|uniref:Holliday junction resolvase-like predicted endonuclease n=1 Tax=Lysinibacter cavernae TaxID=1640652 RepID=A0A7X5TSK1_9MICO|nr:SHOCT domain-containing protein [Lysinibacter cavernae]NIH52509.1 Holliday junction resolvase-like predicted endonuclease [Lysinibacter cavernae]